MHENLEGVFYCEECGRLLHKQTATTLRTRQFEPLPSIPASDTEEETIPINPDVSLVLLIRDSVEPIVLDPGERTTIGRTDLRRPERPDIDLTAYGGMEKGVSRIHAAVERNGNVLTLIDLNSSNGTYLNGHRLQPDRPYPLREGDEVQLGKMVIHIYFKSNERARSGL
jgi:pSer/pThr/pTyr-binding forkhead associated (FHA) protein